ncbi:MAG TPA: glycoside hydrolase family 27 protein, partial [Ktedonobacteraceae bacterium]|nr:glycoside hydrolase family 27 protein [Ktedonobacteraceae bacterium]
YAANAANNGLGFTPYMGWSSWSLTGSHTGYGTNWLTEADIEAQSDAMHQKLQVYGYDYINIDAKWYLQSGSNFAVDAYGRWTPDTTRFPDMAALGAYIHHNWQKFGLYLVPGIPLLAVQQNTPILGTSCHANDIVVQPLAFGNHFKNTYKIDFTKPCAQAYINSLASELHAWGANFLKLDGIAPGSEVPGYDTRDDVKAYAQALAPYHIWLELSSAVDINNASFWQQYANGWRITGDIECYSRCPGVITTWSKVASRFTAAPPWAPFAQRGGWNDFDSLEVGNGSMDGLTDTERQTMMTLWAISAAPLYTGDDITKLDSFGVSLLTNREVLLVDQVGKPATPISQATPQQVWRVRYGDHGPYVVALFNLDAVTATVTVNWSDLGLTGPHFVRDLWGHKNLGIFNGQYSASLPSHGSQLLFIA